MAIQNYVANSDRLNNHLRDPSRVDARTQREIDDLAAVVTRSTLPEDVTLYRAVSLPEGTASGSVYTDPAFFSATLDREFAEAFRRQHPSQRMAIMEVTVAAGSPALLVNNTFEREVILPPDQRLIAASVAGDRIHAQLTQALVQH